jgi:hypothetical protein
MLLLSDEHDEAPRSALPAELLPQAVALLLPLLLLPPERVRALDLAHLDRHTGTDQESEFLSELVVSPAALPGASNALQLCAAAAKWPGAEHGRLLPRARRTTLAGSRRATGARRAGRPRWRARAWCPLSWRRCTSWPSAVRAPLLCAAGARTAV